MPRRILPNSIRLPSVCRDTGRRDRGTEGPPEYSPLKLAADAKNWAMQTGDYAIASFHDLRLSMNEQILIFLAFLLAFAVKVPMFPVHTWLPDAHVEAPTGGSVILAAILLKMGGYGFIRFSLPITPDASQELAWLMITLSLVAVR